MIEINYYNWKVYVKSIATSTKIFELNQDLKKGVFMKILQKNDLLLEQKRIDNKLYNKCLACSK